MNTVPDIIFGQFGLVPTTYVGTAKGSWKGPETCHVYRFEPGSTQYVDRRDQEKMLTYKDAEGNLLFLPYTNG